MAAPAPASKCKLIPTVSPAEEPTDSITPDPCSIPYPDTIKISPAGVAELVTPVLRLTLPDDSVAFRVTTAMSPELSAVLDPEIAVIEPPVALLDTPEFRLTLPAAFEASCAAIIILF